MPTHTAPTSGFINKAQVAAHLGVSEWTIEQLVHAGKLRCFRITPRSWRFDPADVAAFKAACSQTPVPARSAAPSA